MQKIIYRVLLGGLFLWFLTGFLAFQYLIRPTPQKINLPGTLKPAATQTISLTTSDSVQIAGWYIQPESCPVDSSAVILLPCLRGNRLILVDRARFYLARGKHVLLIDLRSTGESGGEFTSFGWYEKYDLLAAYEFLQHQGFEEIGLHGISVGAATICYALPDLASVHFVVLESCYDKMTNAVQNRIQARFGLPEFFFLPIITSAQMKFDFQFYEMNPIDYLHDLKSPVLLIAGNEDPSVLATETMALFRSLPREKQLWMVAGCGHDDFYREKPREYKMHLNSFLKEFHLTIGE